MDELKQKIEEGKEHYNKAKECVQSTKEAFDNILEWMSEMREVIASSFEGGEIPPGDDGDDDPPP